jgi:hypothetical protein
MSKIIYTILMALPFSGCFLTSMGQASIDSKSVYQYTLEEYIKVSVKRKDKGDACFSLDTNNVRNNTIYVVIDSHDKIDSLVDGFRIICMNLDFDWKKYAKDCKDKNETCRQDVLVIETIKIENQNLFMSVEPETLTDVEKSGSRSYMNEQMFVCPTFQFVYDCNLGNWAYLRRY